MSPNEGPNALEGAVGNLIHNSVFSPDECWKGALKFISNIAGLPAVPLELILRRFQGSQYLHFLTVILSVIIFNTMAFFSFGTELSGHHHILTPVVSTSILLVAFWVGAVLHAKRVWHLMQHMDLEEDSELAGPPLKCFRHLPHGDSFGWCRCVYEPAAAFLASAVLYLIGILPIVAAGYLCFAAVCLSFKTSIAWYGEWKYVRTMLDRQNRIPYMQRMAGLKNDQAKTRTAFVVSAATNRISQ